jgi:hypothetical protein
MRFVLVVIGSFALAACGDNLVPETGPATKSPLATTAVGGSQVSHSKSFMLVTNVSAEHSQVAKASKHTIKPGVGGQ